MKNTKKIISLVLAICMLASLAISASAANTVDASGGTGTSSVTLSSTADGRCAPRIRSSARLCRFRIPDC